MLKGYVSLIVPCYNVANTLQSFLDSVLQQTYPYIQLILVNDGSTDSTEEIIKNNIERFREKGIYVDYINQENAGLGAAINTGLNYIDGDYLCWADPDDFFMPDSFEKRVEALAKHSDCGVVTSDAYFYRAGDLLHPVSKASDGLIHSHEANQFEYILKEESIFCSGCHMVRRCAFDDVNPSHEIYPARRGQNWQLLLPVYYRYPRYFLEEPLYGYVLYPQSMSTGDVTEEKVMLRWDEHETILLETLQKIQMSSTEHETYRHMVVTRYAKKRFYSAIDFRDKKTMTEQYQILCGLQENTEDIQKLFFRNRNILCKAIGKLISSIKK